jgi:isomerase DpgB
VLFGRPVDAAEALEIGLVDEVACAGPSAERALDEAVRLAVGSAGPELAIRRRLLMDASTTEYEDSLGAHLSACSRTLSLGPRAVEAGSSS